MFVGSEKPCLSIVNMCSDFPFLILGLDSLATPFHQAQADDLVLLCLHPSDIYVTMYRVYIERLTNRLFFPKENQRIIS